MGKNDTITSTMKTKIKKKPSRNRSFDNHYRSSAEEYELVARLSHQAGVSIADYTRSKLIPRNPLTELEKIRNEQRKAGDPDEWFIHPKLKKV